MMPEFNHKLSTTSVKMTFVLKFVFDLQKRIYKKIKFNKLK